MRMDRKKLVASTTEQLKLRQKLHHKALKRFRKNRHYAKKAIARQLKSLEQQKSDMEEHLRQEMLRIKRKHRDAELREQKWGTDFSGGSNEMIDDSQKILRVQRRISAAGALEGIEKQQVEMLLDEGERAE